MTSRQLVASFSLVLLAGCAQQVTAPQPAPAAEPAAPRAEPGSKSIASSVTLDGYKRDVALRIAANNRHIFTEPLPEMFKSIVVLDITIDRDGNLLQVAVRRSNGFKQLEALAVQSVREAAPYAAPSVLVRRGGSVQFLETFLFRADGRFQIRSLIGT